jgi:hypothetical protein
MTWGLLSKLSARRFVGPLADRSLCRGDSLVGVVLWRVIHDESIRALFCHHSKYSAIFRSLNVALQESADKLNPNPLSRLAYDGSNREIPYRAWSEIGDLENPWDDLPQQFKLLAQNSSLTSQQPRSRCRLAAASWLRAH